MSDASRYDLSDRPWTALYPAGVPATYVARTRNGVEVFQIGVDERPDGPAIYFFDQTLTHRQLDDMAHALAAAFVDLGIKPGDRIGLYLQNDPQFVIALHALWMVGAIGVMHNPMLKARELKYQIDDTGTTMVIWRSGQLPCARSAGAASRPGRASSERRASMGFLRRESGVR